MKKYLTIRRIKRLHEGIGFLYDYKLKEDEDIIVGTNINEAQVKETDLLKELGKLNSRRDIIIETLLNSNDE